ncbi:MAG: hypothetical protein K2H72_06650, partial [Muribaculaceae bacterium]|nr:hypothetical protein [Muribaculaceae bacterium]
TQNTSFAWKRVAMLYQYNAPWIKKQTTIYFLFSLATCLLYLIIPSESMRMSVYGTCSTVLLFMFVWAPVVFTKGGDTRIIDRMIPASPKEKIVFYMSYLLVVVGLACFFCPWMAVRLYHAFYPGKEVAVEAIRSVIKIPRLYEISQYLSTIAAMMTCFYCVVAVRRDRVMKAYLVSTGVYIMASAMNSFYGIKESILWGYKAGVSMEKPADEVEIAEMVYSAMSDHSVFFAICIAISLAYIIMLIWLGYRSLYRKNL